MATTRAMIPATTRFLEFVELLGFIELLGFVESVELPLLIKIDDQFERIRRKVRMP